ncbi:MAG: PucR family transcriptional regulator [Ignavibacteriales bacterium]
MPKDVKTGYHLLEGMLDGGLDFVGSYLSKKIGHSVIITDTVGKIFYPDISEASFEVDDIPPNLADNHYYDPTNNCLYYCIRHNGNDIAYVIVENLPSDIIAQVVSVLAQSELALKYHFSLLNKRKQDFGESLWEHLFLSPGASINDKLKILEKNMDINNFYYISIFEVDESTTELDWNLLRSKVCEFLNRSRSEFVSSIIVPGRLVTILRGNSQDDPANEDSDWPGREALAAAKESIESTFKITVSIAFGGVYRPSGLLRSYQEACMSAALPRLMGKTNFVQYFSQLGVFTALFSLDIETLKNYCLQALGKVIDYDEKHRTDFLSTMRILLDNECSWTTTANQLYVHVNTVYYRMVKVERMLNINFSLFETRLYLFTAIKAWDTLKVCKLID